MARLKRQTFGWQTRLSGLYGSKGIHGYSLMLGIIKTTLAKARGGANGGIEERYEVDEPPEERRARRSDNCIRCS